eukprot:CAMPEP_0194421188 /NCGR_PEP_ID=MMETSP0176-20130528/20407_1 /TAXON_ID=216777 /ORGANISM="Proboscia alata, Strain PI-D3" /LENGTH=76 /DNA_ID=CAMNT_0039229159 /DNA_START=238 /DNA_END=468 /DNA_ORIENTATION=+
MGNFSPTTQSGKPDLERSKSHVPLHPRIEQRAYRAASASSPGWAWIRIRIQPHDQKGLVRMEPWPREQLHADQVLD